MMSEKLVTASKPDYNVIPVQLSAEEFEKFILPHLSLPKRITREVGLNLTGAVLNLDAGFDSKANRKCVFNARMRPNIKENQRNRKKPKRGRKRFFDEVLYKLRFTIERTFAWEDKFKRLLLRFETKQIRHLSFKFIAFTLINLREFCGG
jgi:transposase